MPGHVEPRRGMSVKMGQVAWKIDRLAEGAIHLEQPETRDRLELTLAQWVSCLGTGVLQVIESRRPGLEHRDELAAGVRMRFDETTWKVRVIKDGVIHLVNAASGTTSTISIVDWQEGCYEGRIDMLGSASAELPESIRELLSIPLTSFPPLMQDYVRWATVFVAAYKDPAAFYRERLPDLPEKQRPYPHFLSKKWLVPFLRAVADATGEDQPGASTFCKWMAKIRLADGDMRAVAPRFDCKGPHDRYMSPRVEGWLVEAIDKEWLREGKSKKKKVFEALHDEVGTWNVLNPDFPAEVPSEGHVNRYIRDTVDRYVCAVRRKGLAQAKKEFAQVGEGPKTTYFLERMEMDHTRADVDVMDDKGKVKLGRPWVTTALDHYTRMPIGLVVHFLDQSVSAVFLCLRNTMMPKDFLRKLVPEIDYDYPAGVPVLPFMDRGPDWDTENVRFVLGTFGMIPQYEPVGCPNFKGAIERWQRTLQEEVSHTSPGATPPWSTDGYVWDEDGKAYITLSAYVRRVWRLVSMIYAKEWHRGIQDVPLNRWKESVARKMPRALRKKDDLNVLLTRIVECAVTVKGVESEGLRWGGKVLERIMAHPSFRTEMRVKVRIDDLDVQNAWVINPWTGADEKLDAVFKDYMPGLNWYAHDVARKDRFETGKGVRKESSMSRSKKRHREEAQKFIDGKKGGNRPRVAAARVLGIGARTPSGDDLGGVLPDPEIPPAWQHPALEAMPNPTSTAPVAAAAPRPGPRPATRRVPNH